jgi:hypothetical protein
MADSRLTDALQALVAALATINGAGGGYTYTLTGSDQVIVGMVDIPPQFPCLMIATVTGGTADTSNTLDAYTHEWTVDLVGFVTAADSTTSGRWYAAANLHADVLKCIKANRTLGGACRDVVPLAQWISGSEAGEVGFGMFGLELRISIKNEMT